MTHYFDDPRLVSVLDLDRILLLRSLDGGKGAFLDELIDLFVSSTPPVLEGLISAIEVHSIGESVALAHKLKGISSNVGISCLVAMLERVEVFFADMAVEERKNLPAALTAAYQLAITTLLNEWHAGHKSL